VSTCPQQVDEKDDDCESAAGLELLEEAGQNITKNKAFNSDHKSGFNEVEEDESFGHGGRGGPQKRCDNRCEPGKQEKDQGLKGHSFAGQLPGGPLFVGFGHNLRMGAGFNWFLINAPG
jgi:hypothetical protein